MGRLYPRTTSWALWPWSLRRRRVSLQAYSLAGPSPSQLTAAVRVTGRSGRRRVPTTVRVTVRHWHAMPGPGHGRGRRAALNLSTVHLNLPAGPESSTWAASRASLRPWAWVPGRGRAVTVTSHRPAEVLLDSPWLRLTSANRPLIIPN